MMGLWRLKTATHEGIRSCGAPEEGDDWFAVFLTVQSVQYAARTSSGPHFAVQSESLPGIGSPAEVYEVGRFQAIKTTG
jgi:hypothetical protein